ncbi:MAG: metal ABC transporter solute-binding protein, Zn/Mn family [Opitutales bacterium]
MNRVISKCLITLVFIASMLDASAKTVVTVTTTHLADLVAQVGGDVVEVEALMGPGVDPHLYKPAAPDVRKLTRADLILYNGLLLEGQMGELFERMQKRGRLVVAAAEAVPEERLLASEDYEDHFDPHVWFDPDLWSYAVDSVVAALKQADREHAEVFEQNGSAYKSRMYEASQWAENAIGHLPESSRVLITSHDAFNYFGNRFGLDVIAVQGISTAVEAGLADIAGMVDLIKDREIKAIFVESSVSPAAIERISRDSGAKVGGELLSDSLGTPGEFIEVNGAQYDLGTWEGMFRYNVQTFVGAMKDEG